jgi:hypothetical protein
VSGLIVWHSRDGGPWQQTTINARSLVALAVGGMEFGEIYDDGFGNRYAGDNPTTRGGAQ